MKLLRLFTFSATVLASAVGASAQVAYNTAGASYTQSFDVPGGFLYAAHAWADNSTFTGWYGASYNSGATSWSTPSTFFATNGLNDGSTDFVWYRSGSGSTSMALGTQVTNDKSPGVDGTSGAYYGVEIRNNTGATLTGFTIGYQVEMWRQASGSTPAQETLVASYRVTEASQSFKELGGWSVIDGTSYTTPKSGTGTGSAASLNGNLAENSVEFADITVNGLSIADGQSLWIRWFDVNNTGSEHGIGLDEFTFSATAIPEPAEMAAWGGLAMLGFAIVRRRITRPRVNPPETI